MTGIVAVAKGAGLTNSHWVRDEAHFMQLLDRHLTEGGPLLPGVRIDDKPGPIQTTRDPARIRSSSMSGLGTSRGG